MIDLVPPMTEKAQHYLRHLCVDIPNRCVGSVGNRAATEFFRKTIASFGFRTQSPPFDCMDWREEGADFFVQGEAFPVL